MRHATVSQVIEALRVVEATHGDWLLLLGGDDKDLFADGVLEFGEIGDNKYVVLR